MKTGIQDIYAEQEAAEETFRDKLATVDEHGKRIRIFPKKPKGWFMNRRTVVSVILLVFLFTAPFIKINGQPLLLFNFIERRFSIFGQIFWPQDFYLFVIGMITTVVFIILFTVVFGRIFCGWVCPQTIFMEHVFRRIEYWIEGDYMAQKKLSKQPWNREKIIKKGSKQLIFLIISALIMHTFVAYIIGAEQTFELLASGPAENPTAFAAMTVLTGLFFGVFNYLREQVCTTICPYGRLQGVLLDRNSVVVAYDHQRGEKRAKFRKKEDRQAEGKGDCIECKQCVYVCPTGIDIRNGTQLECVNCTACIDACDDIMDKIDRPKGLIRYASEANIADGQPFRFTNRILAYTTLLFLLVGVLITLLVIRTDFDTTVLRSPGTTFQTREDGTVTNLYQVKMINKTLESKSVRIELISPPGEVQMVQGQLTLPPQGVTSSAFFVAIHPRDLESMSNKVQIGVYSDNELIKTVKTKFLAP